MDHGFMSDYAVEMRNITKDYADLRAVNDFSLSIEKGESHALLGCVGAGKTAILKMLCGLTRPDQGQIRVNGKIGFIDRAFFRGQGASLLDHILLYCPGEGKRTVGGRAEALCAQYGFSLDLNASPRGLSNAARKQAALLALLCGKKDILVLDELASPAQYRADEYFHGFLKKITADGKTVIFSARTAWEALGADRCTVLREGRALYTLSVRDLDAEAWPREMREQIGIPSPQRREIAPGGVMLSAREISVRGRRKRTAARRVSFEARSGEILCVAGLPGSGAEELCDALTGQRPLLEGKLTLMGESAGRLSAPRRMELGLGYVPDPGRRQGWALDGSIRDNLLLRRYREKQFQDGGLMKRDAIAAWVEEKKLDEAFLAHGASFRGLTPAQRRRAAFLRETDRDIRLLIAENPARGSDRETAAFLWDQLMAFRNGRGAVILFSADYEEIRALADRLLVIREGEIVAEMDVSSMTALELDMYLLGDQRQPRYGGEAWEDLEE